MTIDPAIKLDGAAMLFSFKCFIAAILAYYGALNVGLNRPYWAVATCYIVAQPLAGAVLSKAAFRLMGTFVGASAAILLVPNLVNEPIILSAALALWLGLCLYIALLDRTPRAYVFLLAGYIASIIGFPSVDAPGTIFQTSVLRVEEIGIGIVASGLVHGLIFPRTVTGRLLARIDIMLVDGERWSRDALSGARIATLDKERRRLATDLAELHQLSIHLPFDTARLLPRIGTVRALEDQLTMLLPLTSAVEDRLIELAERVRGIPPMIADHAARVAAWLDQGLRGDVWAASAQSLIDEGAMIAPKPGTGATPWRDMLIMNLLSRLGDLIATHRDARALVAQLRSPSARAQTPHIGALLARASGRALHRDHGIALRVALGTAATIGLGCAFWIATGWTDGAGAVLLAGISCALFGNVDRPGPVIFIFLIGFALSAPIAALYAYAILPRVTDFVTLTAVLAPPLLLAGSMLARPPYTLLSLGLLLGFLNSVGLNASYSDGFAPFANAAIAGIIGVGFSVITVGLFQTIGTDHSVARLARAGWRDVATRSAGRAPDSMLWVSRMLDRIALLIPRLNAADRDPDAPLLDALADLRVGYVAGELARIAPTLPADEQGPLKTMLRGIERHFRALNPTDPATPSGALLDDVDRSICMADADDDVGRRCKGLVMLTSIRRNLFPDAPSYGVAT